MDKRVALGFIALGALGFAYYLYKNSPDNNKRSTEQDSSPYEERPLSPRPCDNLFHGQQNPNMKHDLPLGATAGLRQLSQSINKQHPTLAQMKDLFHIIVDESRKNDAEFIRQFKEGRRQRMNKNFGEYLRYIRDGLNQMKIIHDRSELEVLKSLGMSKEQFEKGVMVHPEAFEESEAHLLKHDSNTLDLKQIKDGVQYQKSFLRNNGTLLFSEMRKQISSWNEEDQQLIHQVINVVFSDETFEKFGFEEEDVEKASVRYRQELSQEIIELNRLITQFLMQMEEEQEDPKVAEAHHFIKIDSKVGNLPDGQKFQKVMDLMHEE